MFPQTLYFGLVSLVVTLLMPIYYTLREKKINLYTLIFVFLFSFYNLYLLTKGNSGIGIYYFLLQLLVVLFITCFENLRFSKTMLRKICSACQYSTYVLLIYNLFLYLFENQLGIIYRSYFYAMRPVLYGMMLLSLFSKECSNRMLYLKLIFYAFFMFIFTERTQALGLLILIIIHFVLSIMTNNIYRKLLFGFYSSILAAIPSFFIYLYNSAYSSEMNYWVSNYTHKNLFSGRQELWRLAIERIGDNFLTGYGFDTYIFNYGERAMSVHNTYLFFMLQVGIISVFLTLILFYMLFSKLCNRPRNYDTNLSVAILLVVMFLASFGLILFANNILYSVFLWIAIGIGLLKFEDNMILT